MQFNVKTEKWGSGSQKWLGSAHGTDVARSVTIDGTKLAGFTDMIPSGTPLKKSEAHGKYEPVTSAEDKLAGFLLTDQSLTTKGADVIAPMIWHGRIRAQFLPKNTFDVTTLTTTPGGFTIDKETD
ncbi:Uncharacterised protein [Corynebacterium kutscheri]|uniref:Uncharacterized protein n=1 Tax=Corynebacterium kutscheri TaxID=35755 RepID=A0AB38VX82_9CORY|nr:hypothetical protein [Corynebacterium kutscheri]VEH07010.1 Uncharacterised protein [Corynebacterium kutscheri]VEH79506.1 Uncharacterised protein [Corynebacterium kutscheri]